MMRLQTLEFLALAAPMGIQGDLAKLAKISSSCNEKLTILKFGKKHVCRSSESDDESSSDGCTTRGSKPIDMTLQTLHSLHALNESNDGSIYAQHGANTDRIKELLADPVCPCKCQVPFKVLHKVCRSFWSLPKQSQDALLWTIQSSGSRRSTWQIEGLLFAQQLKVDFYLWV